MKIVILAGGGGTRLWPLSRQDFPKQFLKLGSDQSLLQQTVNRFLSVVEPRDIVISTNQVYEDLVRAHLQKMGLSKDLHILVEPNRRNTAPAIALAVRYFENASPDEPILIVPSDHLIEPKEIFLNYLTKIKSAIEQGKIVTFGIRPTKPDTGFGYIKISSSFDAFSYHIDRFVEKPDIERAHQYLADPRYYWNSGMFAFSIATFWDSLACHLPDIAALKNRDWDSCLTDFHRLPSVSIDYGLMEKEKNLVVCPLPVTWSDIGSWDNVYEILEKDGNRNVKIGNIIDIETKNCLIFGGKKLISVLGLEDLLIVDTEDAIFISKKGQSQKVRDLVQKRLSAEEKTGTNRKPGQE